MGGGQGARQSSRGKRREIEYAHQHNMYLLLLLVFSSFKILQFYLDSFAALPPVAPVENELGIRVAELINPRSAGAASTVSSECWEACALS